MSHEEQEEYGFFGLLILWIQSLGVWLTSLVVFIIMAWMAVVFFKFFS